jgi:hypothetical protein
MQQTKCRANRRGRAKLIGVSAGHITMGGGQMAAGGIRHQPEDEGRGREWPGEMRGLCKTINCREPKEEKDAA